MNKALMLLLLFAMTFGCKQKVSKNTGTDELQAIFPKGQLGSAEYFTGNAYNYGLVPMDSVYTQW